MTAETGPLMSQLLAEGRGLMKEMRGFLGPLVDESEDVAALMQAAEEMMDQLVVMAFRSNQVNTMVAEATDLEELQTKHAALVARWNKEIEEEA